MLLSVNSKLFGPLFLLILHFSCFRDFVFKTELIGFKSGTLLIAESSSSRCRLSICFCKRNFLVNFELHNLQANGLSPVCVKMCLFKSVDQPKQREQYEQRYLRSIVFVVVFASSIVTSQNVSGLSRSSESRPHNISSMRDGTFVLQIGCKSGSFFNFFAALSLSENWTCSAKCCSSSAAYL